MWTVNVNTVYVDSQVNRVKVGSQGKKDYVDSNHN